jgi:hypothetical protein
LGSGLGGTGQTRPPPIQFFFEIEIGLTLSEKFFERHCSQPRGFSGGDSAGATGAAAARGRAENTMYPRRPREGRKHHVPPAARGRAENTMYPRRPREGRKHHVPPRAAYGYMGRRGARWWPLVGPGGPWWAIQFPLKIEYPPLNFAVKLSLGKPPSSILGKN